MKKFFKNDIYIYLTLFFIFLIFKNNVGIKNCIINGSIIFFHKVFPSLFPFFIINDILLNYNFCEFLSNTIYPIFKIVFKQSKIATYIFVMAIFSGTPTNAYLTANLVNNKILAKKDASIILTYSTFLNPFFVYTIFSSLFSINITIKLMLIYYFTNFIIAFLNRGYKYENQEVSLIKSLAFSKVLSKSIKRAIDTLLVVYGTILFYLLLCEGITFFINNPLLNCLVNGVLESTGGLTKLINLNINIPLKELLALSFISFGGFSIHTQIKNILVAEDISYKPFFIARCLQVLLGASCLFIIS